MPALTRRRYHERPDCWHVYYGDVRVGAAATFDQAGAEFIRLTFSGLIVPTRWALTP
jgi:hypothetical protein